MNPKNKMYKICSFSFFWTDDNISAALLLDFGELFLLFTIIRKYVTVNKNCVGKLCYLVTKYTFIWNITYIQHSKYVLLQYCPTFSKFGEEEFEIYSFDIFLLPEFFFYIHMASNLFFQIHLMM